MSETNTDNFQKKSEFWFDLLRAFIRLLRRASNIVKNWMISLHTNEERIVYSLDSIAIINNFVFEARSITKELEFILVNHLSSEAVLEKFMKDSLAGCEEILRNIITKYQ